MPERTSYAHGVPSWIDLSTPDVASAVAFYGGLFGWEAGGGSEAPEDVAGYDVLTLRGRAVAGIAPLMQEGQPTVWSTYVAVDDVDDAAAKATAAGGQVTVEPMDVMSAGRMAFVTDPAGTWTGLWQARDHIGAQLVNEPGTFGWSELTTRDRAGALGFYPQVFGWEAEPFSDDEDGYMVWNVAGRAVCGLMEMGDEYPAEVPSHWMTYFIVDDADASAASAAELGGTICVAPFDVPGVGRIAVIDDPHGATFSIMAMAEPAQE